MRNKIFLTLIFIILAAIGAQAQNDYKSAKEKVKIGGKTLIVKSQIYLNLMPGVISENQNKTEDCSITGRLIAPVTLENDNGGRLPKQIEVNRIWIKNNDSWRQILFNKDETNVKETSLYAVARDCPNDKFEHEKVIIVVVELKYKGKTFYIRSNQTKLEKAF